ncbi:MAG: hypothetical protein IIA73_00900 [Proteobacteria bacterium]|nr:hypothetical protein [Pseudomonadota bacterium]
MAGEDTELLSQTARRTRRMILIVAPLALLLGAYPELEPTRISALGLDVPAGSASGLVPGSLFLINAYLLIWFAWLALRDAQSSDGSRFLGTFKAYFNRPEIVRLCTQKVKIRFRSDFNTAKAQLIELVDPVGVRSIRRENANLAGVPGFRRYLELGTVIARVCLSQAKRVLFDRVTVFWIMEFWFPVCLGVFALTGNWTAAYQLLFRVFVGP